MSCEQTCALSKNLVLRVSFAVGKCKRDIRVTFANVRVTFVVRNCYTSTTNRIPGWSRSLFTFWC